MTDQTDETDQSQVLAFLAAGGWPGATTSVETHATHGATVFLSGDTALKVKRAVRLPYLDFSTLAARETALRRELELNLPHAPALYRDVVPITRAPDGTHALAGPGEVVEWALRMRRFSQDLLLLSIVERGAMTKDLAYALADRIRAYHAAAPRPPDARDRIADSAASLLKALRRAPDRSIAAQGEALDTLVGEALADTAAIRRDRHAAGLVRRCHGDLHLANIVVLDGAPVLFDALEFDETLATIDTLYDLAFPLMDLDRHGASAAAQLVLDRYLARSVEPLDRRSLPVMPLFLAIRAMVRSVVAIDRLKGSRDPLTAVLPTLDLAARYLRTPPSASRLFTTP